MLGITDSRFSVLVIVTIVLVSTKHIEDADLVD